MTGNIQNKIHFIFEFVIRKVIFVTIYQSIFNMTTQLKLMVIASKIFVDRVTNRQNIYKMYLYIILYTYM